MYDSCFMEFVINAEIRWNSSTYNWEHGERETKNKWRDWKYHAKSSMPWNIVGISVLYLTVEQQYEGVYKHNFYQIKHGD